MSGGVRGQPVAVLSAVSYDCASGRVIGAEVPTVGAVGGPGALRIESYDSVQGGAWSSDAQAERALRLRQQALEARHKHWLGRGVVRSFAAGTRFAPARSKAAPSRRALDFICSNAVVHGPSVGYSRSLDDMIRAIDAG